MKSQTRRIIDAYKKGCRALLEEFVEMYWSDLDYILKYDLDYFVIGSWCITGVIGIEDYFINWEEMEYCVLYQVPPETFWAWKQYQEMMDYDTPINFKTFFESYPNLPCTKAKTTTKRRSSTTKPSIVSRRQREGKR